MELKTTKEARSIINLSQRRIAELCDAGEFPGAFKKSDTWLIPEDALLIYILNHPKNKRRDSDTATERKSAEAELANALKENEAQADVS